MNRFALVMMTSFIAVLMLSSIAYTFSKCGPRAFLLGSGEL